MRNLYVLNEQMIPVAVLNPELPNGCPFFDDQHVERLQYGEMTFDFEVPADHETASLLTTEGFVIYTDLDNEMQLFRIKEITDSNSGGEFRKKVHCENAAVTDLIGTVVRPTTLSSYTLEQAMNYVLSGTDWVLGVAEYSGVKDFKIDDYKTALEALHDVLDAFGAEIKFTVDFNGTRVVAKKVNALIRRGQDTGKVFEYGLDLQEVERVENTEELFTALVGVGKGDSSGSVMTFANVPNSQLTFDSTKYERIEGNDWVGSIDAFRRWAINGKHRMGIYRDDKAQNPIELFNNTLAELDRVSKPRLTYKVKVVLLEQLLGYEAHRVRLGDTVVVKDTTFKPDLILEARVIEMKRSMTNPDTDEVTLGEFVPILSSPIQHIKEIKNRLDQKESSWDRSLYSAGTGMHVIAQTPKPLVNGDYATAAQSLTIQVTENVHIGYVSVYCQMSGLSGTIELRDGSGKTLETRQFTNLVAGENRLKLDFLLRQDIGTYQLYGSFSGATFRTTSGLSFPYDSGSFKVTGTTASDGYWYHFYDISVGGPGVKGAYGQELRLGDRGNRWGRVVAYDTNGETAAIIDENQIVMGNVVATNVQAPNIVTTGIPSGTTVTYYVNASTGSDNNDGSSGAPLASVYGAIKRLPRVFDGNVTIYLQSDIYEDVTISGFMGSGKIRIVMNGYTMTGTFLCKSVKMRVELFGGTESSTNIYGRINAKAGESTGVIQIFETDYFYGNYLKVYGNSGTGGCTGVVTTYDNSFAYFYKCEFYNAVSACVYSAYGGKTMLHTCVGTGAPYGVMADYAGYIGWSTQIPAGTSSPIQATNGGMVTPSSVQSGQSGTGTGGTTPTAPTVSSWNSSVGDSWRTVYNSWRGDGTVRQGQWQGYGLHTGIWIFPSSMSSAVTGKTIKRIRAYLTRLQGGYANVSVTLRMHSHTSIPSGQPPVLTPTYNVTFSVGDSKWIDLPSSWFSYFSNGTAKGIGLYTSNDADAYYAVFDDSATIEITYV